MFYIYLFYFNLYIHATPSKIIKLHFIRITLSFFSSIYATQAILHLNSFIHFIFIYLNLI